MTLLELVCLKICITVPNHHEHPTPTAVLVEPLSYFFRNHLLIAKDIRKFTFTYKLCIRYFCLSMSLFNFQTSCIELLLIQCIVPTPNIPLYHRCTKYLYQTSDAFSLATTKNFKNLTHFQMPFPFFTR